jgi:hypothetical protein
MEPLTQNHRNMTSQCDLYNYTGLSKHTVIIKLHVMFLSALPCALVSPSRTFPTSLDQHLSYAKILNYMRTKVYTILMTLHDS